MSGPLAPGTYDLEPGGAYVLHVPEGEAPPEPDFYTLTVTHAGDGSGIITGLSGSGRYASGLSETGEFPAGTEVTLGALPDPGSEFDGFDPAMPIVMDQDQAVVATFSLLPLHTLTVATDGDGHGIADGGGEYVEGTVIDESVVSATPAEGSTFAGWTPALPITLAADQTLTATFSLVPVGPPITGAGTWTKLTDVPTSLWAYGYEGGCVDTTRGEFMTHWPAGSCRSATWPLAGGPGRRRPRSSTPWKEWPDHTAGQTPGDAAHNSVACYDPINDRVWFSAFGPLPNPGAYGWNPATRKYFRYGANGPATLVDALMVFDPVRQQLLAIGGYSNTNGWIGRLPLVPLPTDQSAWKSVQTVAGPPLYTNAQPPPSVGFRLTYTRGGWDPGLNVAWLVDDLGDLWRYWPQSNAWVKHLTTGNKPPIDTVYAMDSISRLVIGWSGKNFNTQADIRQTRVLNLATMEWLTGPSGGSGTPVASTVASMSGYTIHGRAHFFISTGPSTLWRFLPENPDPVAPPNPEVPPPSGGGGGGDGGIVMPPIVIPPPEQPTEPGPILPYPDLDTLPPRTFVPVTPPSVTTGLDTTPWPAGGGSKHQRWAADGQGHVWTGFGDTSPSHYPGNPSQNQGYRLNAANGHWTRWNPTCRPAGQIMPSWPDEVLWDYDRRGAFWLLGGVTQGSDGASCGAEGAVMYKTGLFRYDPELDVWTRFVGPQGTNALYGRFDNRDKCLLYFGIGANTGSGYGLWKLNVDTLEQKIAWGADLSANPYPGAPAGTFENYCDLRTAYWAWDEEGRCGYILGYHQEYVQGSPKGGPLTLHLWRFHVDTGVRTLLPPVPFTPLRNNSADAQHIVFDTKRRQVVIPYTPTHCGALEAMATFQVDTEAWALHSLTPSEPVPGVYIRGNSAVYEPLHDVVIVGGSVACPDWGYPGVPAITHYFLWRG